MARITLSFLTCNPALSWRCRKMNKGLRGGRARQEYKGRLKPTITPEVGCPGQGPGGRADGYGCSQHGCRLSVQLKRALTKSLNDEEAAFRGRFVLKTRPLQEPSHILPSTSRLEHLKRLTTESISVENIRPALFLVYSLL